MAEDRIMAELEDKLEALQTLWDRYPDDDPAQRERLRTTIECTEIELATRRFELGCQ